MRKSIVPFVLALVGASPLAAQDWSGNLTLYGWLPSIEGAQEGPDGTPVIQLTAADLLDNLDGVFFGIGEIRRGRLGFLFEGVSVNLGAEAQAQPPFSAAAATDTRIGFASAALAWRIADTLRGAKADVYGGLRYYDASIDIDVTLPGVGVDTTVSGEADWVDPILGVRGSYPIGNRLALVGFADAGGFGAGSELTWQAYAGMSYDFSETFTAQLGYRYLSIDYEDNITLDIVLEGPVLGLTFRF